MNTPQQQERVLLSLQQKTPSTEATTSWGFWISDGVHASSMHVERLTQSRRPLLTRYGARTLALGKM